MELKCWFCGTWFEEGNDLCEECRWHKCSYCGLCYCDLSKETQRAVDAMLEQYERAKK